MKRISLLGVPLLLGALAHGDLFSSVEHMSDLAGTVADVGKHLQRYLEDQALRIQELKAFLQRGKALFPASKENENAFLANPSNSYMLINFLLNDWKNMKSTIEQTDAKFLNSKTDLLNLDRPPVNIYALAQSLRIGSSKDNLAWIRAKVNIRQVHPWPTEDDRKGVMVALFRLMEEYKLNMTALVRGELKLGGPPKRLTAKECLDITLDMIQAGFSGLIPFRWAHEAFQLWAEETDKTVSSLAILDTMSTEYGVAELSLKVIPTRIPNARYVKLAQKYETIRTEDAAEGARYADILKKEAKRCRKFVDDILNAIEEPNVSVPRCHGNEKLNDLTDGRLRCRLHSGGDPYLRLGPVKQEVVSTVPIVEIYYDVIFDKEMKYLMETAKPLLARATVNSGLGYLTPSKSRISKTKFLYDIQNKYRDMITRRVSIITGLETMENAEDLQLNNYGIGGYYGTHHDSIDYGDHDGRLATWMFYLTDVPQGGATLFPNLGLRLNPIRGAATFWYNIYRQGGRDSSTMHSGCPVLEGNKWVGNFWIHYLGQKSEPCGLDEMDKYSR